MHNEKNKELLSATEKNKKSIDIIRQEMTKLYASMNIFESYEKARAGSLISQYSGELFFVNEKGARSIWQVQDSDGKLLYWAVAESKTTHHGAVLGLKTKEEAIQVRDSRKG